MFQFHLRPKSNTETHASSSSAPTNIGTSSYDRSNRLKGRDEGIRWVELLEKFRTVQEKARRARRPGGELDHNLGISDGRTSEGLDSRAFKDLTRLQGPPLVVKDASVTPAGSQPQARKSKGSLGNFGRLGGAVSGSRPKR